MRVRNVMTSNAAFVRADDRLIEAAQSMASAGADVLPVVCDKDRLIGVITDRDIVVHAVAEGRDPRSTRVQEVMTAEFAYCFEDEDVDRIAETMTRLQVTGLPVVDRSKRLVGVTSPRARALLFPPLETRATVLRVGTLTLDLIDRTAMRGDREIELLPREFKLLEYFMRRPEQLVTREMLLRDVWKYRFLPQSNVVDVHIGKVRRKLDLPGEPQLLANVRGAGFVLKPETPGSPRLALR